MPNAQNIAIIGAGQMGCGIGEVCLLAGHQVMLLDQESGHLDRAKCDFRQRFQRKYPDRADALLSALTLTTEMNVITDAQMCIEAIDEDESLKRQVLKQMQRHLSDQCLVASNTSSISITRLAATISRPENFIGLHFMNPVPQMPLVEVVRGLQTSEETFAQAARFIEAIGKTVVVSEDFPAFIVNRILIPMINEAIQALHEGVGNVHNIDTAMKLGAHHPMGPLELADYIGLDTILAILQVLYEELADAKYRPCPLLNRYVEAGWLGRKTGRGFYDYAGDTPVPTR